MNVSKKIGLFLFYSFSLSKNRMPHVFPSHGSAKEQLEGWRKLLVLFCHARRRSWDWLLLLLTQFSVVNEQ